MKRHLLTVLLWLIPVGAWAQTQVPVWTYYTTPPFDAGTGQLTRYLCDFLTERSAGRWRFVPSYMPRKRVQANLTLGQAGVLAWVNPSWLDDIGQQRYLWTEGLVWGSNRVVSRIEQPVSYQGPASLEGKVLGAILGHYLVGLEPLVADGRLIRTDAVGAEANLKRLLSGRVDVALIPDADLSYLLDKLGVRDRVFVAELPHQAYARHFLFSRDLAPVYEYMVGQLPALYADPHWQRLLAGFGLHRVER